MALKIEQAIVEATSVPQKAREGSVTMMQKVIKSDTYMVLAQSAPELEDEFQNLYYSTAQRSNLFLQPPFSPLILKQLVTTNNILDQCVEVMEVNIDSTGHEFVKISDSENAPPISPQELKEAESFFAEPYPNTSFTKMRRKLRRNMESVGYDFLEVLRTVADDVVGVRNVDTHHMRMVKLDDPIQVTKKITRNGKDVSITYWDRERRYGQLIGGKQKIYYREFGATRHLNRDTGEWESASNKVPPDKRASELLMFGVHPHDQTSYFIPRWINQMPSVIGSRKAEEANLDFFDAGGIPPAIIFIQGGTLAKSATDQLNTYLSGNKKSQYRAAVVEAQSTSGTMDSAGSVQVKVERFGAERSQDAFYSSYDQAAEEHVRVAFRIPPLFLGKPADYNFACYSDDTETLTDKGWIKWDEYESGMRIATVNPQTLVLEYHKPFGDRALVYDVKDVPMYHVFKQNVDILVTPKHRMMYSTDKGPRRVEPIEDMMTLCRVNLSNHVSGRTGGQRLQQFMIPQVMTGTYDSLTLGGAVVDGDVFLEFLGYWISEGHSSTAYSQRGVVTVSQKKQPHLQKIEACMSQLPCKQYRSEQPTGLVQLSVKNFGLKQWLLDHCGQKAPGKRLPALFRTLPENQLQILFDALMLGDGTIDARANRSSCAYSSTSSQLADDVQELAIMLGYRATVRRDRPGTLGVRPVYRVLMTKDAADNQIDIQRDVKKVNYTGKVYCFSVPNGVFVTRRNGKVALQGNTAVTAYMVAEEQVFQPERSAFDETINMTLIKAMGWKTLKIKSKPITLSDATMQVSALQLVAQKVTTASLVSQVEKMTGLTLEALDQQVMPGGDVTHLPAGTEIPTDPTANEPNPQVPPTIVPKDPEVIPAPKPAPKKTTNVIPFEKGRKTARELIDLTKDYVALKGLTRQKRDLSEDRKAEVIVEVERLTPEDQKAFDALVAQYSFGSDDPDLVNIGKHVHAHG